ncbi:TM0106 family RecB-like putative nuclease [Leucobacter insecticola]|uniref:TM0106 family RecB-like putative nuclease n=1 Tax=Leucobacter insecticola TaxID=2714934 RepID=A0A6G8FIW7_9MICO|nr:TM0106 family RecB-like putative nuclease [Leucobacter insecticola]
MFLQHNSEGSIRLVTSASDLTAASACEFAFLRRADVKFGRNVEVPADDDPMLRRAAKLGDAHEDRVLQEYRREFGAGTAGQPGGVTEIPRPASMRETDLIAVAKQTQAAFAGGADIVFQATFFDPAQRPADPVTSDPEIGFIGFADFLQRMPDGAYEVQDTKLARRAKVSALMQLAAYAEQLERVGVPVSPEAVLILGDGARSRHRIADIAPVFRQRRSRLHEILLDRARAVGADGTRASAAPIVWGAEGIAACGRCEVCAPEIERTRDPLLIAGIRRTQRDALVAAGYDTIDAVAGLNRSGGEADDQQLPIHECVILEPELPAIPGVSEQVLERLSAQAQMQLAAVQGEAPPVRVFDPAALAAIPQPNPGDLFFDFEGDPMYREPGETGAARWGIDYLFGLVDLHEQFTALWAHTLVAEKQALIDFLELVRARRAQYPAMKIYHYASYERTHLLSLAVRHGVGEGEVDQLLREHVFVDLYPIVRRALRVGSNSYSIKKLEPLYMGSELRDESGVTSAAQSVTEYAEAMAQINAEDPETRAEGQRRLDAIADYNRYDCVSTLRLRDWLLSLASAHQVAPYPPEAVTEAETPDLELSTVAGALAMHAAIATEPRDRKAAALAASAIDYHQREQKSFWWAHFARLTDPIEDWAETRDVMVIDWDLTTVVENWFLPPRARSERRHIRLRGEISPGSSLKPGSDAFLLYEYPSPFPQHGAVPGSRGARRVKIAERFDDGVTVEEVLSGDMNRYDALPVALVPGAPPRAGAQKGAIEEWGALLAQSLDRGSFPSDPVVDLLRRTPPRFSVRGGLAALSAEHDDPIALVTAALRHLDRSYLAVQGPPGTGKTYLAAHVIKTLVEDHGWRIGVVAQSHRVVENVLDGVVRAGLDPTRVGKVPQGGSLAEGLLGPATRS